MTQLNVYKQKDAYKKRDQEGSLPPKYWYYFWLMALWWFKFFLLTELYFLWTIQIPLSIISQKGIPLYNSNIPALL